MSQFGRERKMAKTGILTFERTRKTTLHLPSIFSTSTLSRMLKISYLHVEWIYKFVDLEFDAQLNRAVLVSFLNGACYVLALDRKN